MQVPSNEARTAQAAGDPTWPRPVAVALEAARAGLALEWALRVCGGAIEALPDAARARPQGLLDRARRALSSAEMDLADEGEQMWYLAGRDDFQTACARLCWAGAAQRKDNQRGYLLEVTFAVGLFVAAAPDQGALDRALVVAENLATAAGP